MLAPILENSIFFNDFFSVFQGYTFKFIDFSTTQSKKKYLTPLFLQTFVNILKVVEIGISIMREKLRLGAWRLVLYILGEGGLKLESLIKKSDQFIKGVPMNYLEGDLLNLTESKGRRMSLSDSGYSSQLSSALENDSDSTSQLENLIAIIKVKCTDILRELVDAKQDSKASVKSEKSRET